MWIDAGAHAGDSPALVNAVLDDDDDADENAAAAAVGGDDDAVARDARYRSRCVTCWPRDDSPCVAGGPLYAETTCCNVGKRMAWSPNVSDNELSDWTTG